MKKLISYVADSSFVKFLLVGILNTFVGMSIIFISLNLFNLDFWLSTFFGNFLGMLVSFLCNRKFTFKSDISFISGYIKFLIVCCFCYLIAYSAGLMVVTVFCGSYFSDRIIKNISAITGMLLYTLLNYFGHRMFTFKTKHILVDGDEEGYIWENKT